MNGMRDGERIELEQPDGPVLTEKEVYLVAHCLEDDKVEPLKPLVEEYGFIELIKRFNNSVIQS